MNKKYYSIAIAVMTGISFLSAQTNPTPWNLNSSGNYSFTSFGSSSSSFPASMVIHQLGASPSALSTAATADVPLPCFQQQSTNTNVWGLNAQGIGIRSNPASASIGYTAGRSNQVVVAVNTTSRNNVKVSFKAGSFATGSSQSAIYRMRCQYRVGASGSWLDMPGGAVEYQSVNVADSVNMGPYSLPSAVNNQAVVQLRWVYYYVSGSWSVSKNRTQRVRLDDISITSAPIVSQSPFSPVCVNASPFTLSGGSPSGGTYSGPGVVGGTTFNPSLAGVGTYTLTYTYTDAGGTGSATQPITVMAKPSVGASASANPICFGNSITLNGSGASTYTWTGGVTNGTAFSPSSTSTYTVTGTNSNGCTNSSAITVTVNSRPTVTANASSNPVCSGNSTTLSGGGASSYAWSGGVGNGIAFTPSSTAAYTVTGTDNNGCSSSSMITLTVNATPTVNVSGTMTITAGTSTALSATGASAYTWGPSADLSSSAGASVTASPTTTTQYTLTGTTNNCSDSKTFMVTVIPGGPAHLQAAYCGITQTSLNQVLYIDAVNNATNYQYEITDNASGSVYTYVRGNNLTNLQFNWLWQIGYGKTYSVRVAAYVNGAWTLYGYSCNVTTPPPPATQLSSGSCGAALTSLDQPLYCDWVVNAGYYRYEVTDVSSGAVSVYTRTTWLNNFQLDWLSNTGYSKSYSIRVASSVGGTWLSYGPACTVTTPARPATQLAAGSCGITETTLDQSLSCTSVVGASNYMYEITDASNGSVVTYTRGNNLTNLGLDWISSTQYGKTYNIRVASYVDGTWSTYGPTCSVTTPAAPTTKLQSQYCGITVSSLSTPLYVDAVNGATDYLYEINDLSSGYVGYYARGNWLTNLQLDWMYWTSMGKTYSIRVSAKVGGSWIAFGPACTVSTSGAARLANESTESTSADRMLLAGEQSAKLYPNPNKGSFTLETSRAADVRISNLLGVNVYNGRVAEGAHLLDLGSIEPGVYLVQVYDGKNSWLMRMVKE